MVDAPPPPPDAASISSLSRDPSSSDAKTFHQQMAADEEQELHDRPLWTAECSFRGSQYRYLGHQSGVVGAILPPPPRPRPPPAAPLIPPSRSLRALFARPRSQAT
jgi:hypothetical protein